MLDDALSEHETSTRRSQELRASQKRESQIVREISRQSTISQFCSASELASLEVYRQADDGRRASKCATKRGDASDV